MVRRRKEIARMSKILFDDGNFLEGDRYTCVVAKTAKGIAVTVKTAYVDEDHFRKYYRDGQYPELPDDWDEDGWDWLRDLLDRRYDYKPYRSFSW